MPASLQNEQPNLDSEDTLEEQANKIRREALLPAVSLGRYEEAYRKFNEWRTEKFPDAAPNQNMMLVYLKFLSATLAASSLWTIYSMLKRQFMASFIYLFYFYCCFYFGLVWSGLVLFRFSFLLFFKSFK